mmetsp:Transcript_27832/g.35821  ORF Transcript_27832/g.35821 Transcript_27832/m.35821 type:complete len:108 (-) Transcript_27832:384-707(-)
MQKISLSSMHALMSNDMTATQQAKHSPLSTGMFRISPPYALMIAALLLTAFRPRLSISSFLPVPQASTAISSIVSPALLPFMDSTLQQMPPSSTHYQAFSMHYPPTL